MEELNDLETKVLKLKQELLDLAVQHADSIKTHKENLEKLKEELQQRQQAALVDSFTSFTQMETRMFDTLQRYTVALSNSHLAGDVTRDIVVPLARQFPNMQISMSSEFEVLLPLTVGEEEYLVSVVIKHRVDEYGLRVTPPVFEVWHDIEDWDMKPLVSSDLFDAVVRMTHLIKTEGLNAIREIEARRNEQPRE
jgi:hypothetical protein